jgi:hypothetical protein
MAVADTEDGRANALAAWAPYAFVHYPPTGVIDADRRASIWQYKGIPISAASLVPGAVQIDKDVQIGLTQAHLVDVTLSRSLTMKIGRTKAFDVER